MSVIANHTADINTGVDTDLHPVTDYCPQLAPLGIYVGHLYILPVQSQVGDFSPGAKVTPFTDDAIAHIVVVGDFATFHDNGILHLYSAADMAIIAN